jgi:hypothetical protein
MLENMLKNAGYKAKDISVSIDGKLLEIKKYDPSDVYDYSLKMINPETGTGFVSDYSLFDIKKHKNGLYTALFQHGEAWKFNYDNFLYLHNQSQHIPMYAIHADESY